MRPFFPISPATTKWRHPRTFGQALSALLFLYREVLHQELEGRIEALRARKAKRLPTVLTREEVRGLLAQVAGPPSLLLMVQVMYGSGLRLTECLRLRVKDLDFAQHQILGSVPVTGT